MHAWEQVIVSTEKIAKVHGDLAKKINEQCAEPVASFVKDMDRQREKSVQDGQKSTKEYDDATGAAEKAKQAFFRASQENEVLEKGSTKAAQAAEKVKMTDFDYREKVQQANAIQEKHLKEAMPKALDVSSLLSLRPRILFYNRALSGTATLGDCEEPPGEIKH